MAPLRRVVLADSDVVNLPEAVARLRRDERADVVTVTMDLVGAPGLEAMRDRALAAGASRAHVLDVREAFVQGFVLPALKADAVDRGGHPLGGPLGLALAAEQLVEVAAIEQADGVAHGFARAEEQQTFDQMVRALNPALTVIDLAAGGSAGFRPRANLWGGPPSASAHNGVEREGPDRTASAEIGFERGVPTSINGVALSFLDLVASLNTIASTHRIERLIADFDGGASHPRVIHEVPAASLLHLAHEGLRKLVMSDDLGRFWSVMSRRYVELIEGGMWFTPMRHALDALVGELQGRISGRVNLELRNGECRVAARHSVHAVTCS